jgi:hypothetical protein
MKLSRIAIALVLAVFVCAAPGTQAQQGQQRSGAGGGAASGSAGGAQSATGSAGGKSASGTAAQSSSSVKPKLPPKLQAKLDKKNPTKKHGNAGKATSGTMSAASGARSKRPDSGSPAMTVPKVSSTTAQP